MMKTLPCIYFLVIITAKLYSQSAPIVVGAGSMGTGCMTAALPDAFALLQNPAGLGMLRNSSIAATSDRRLGLVGANSAASAVTLQSKIGAFSAGAYRFGDKLYSEQLLSFGYGNKLGLASLGARADYIQYRAEGYDPFITIGITLGTMAKITKQLVIGAYATNINRPRFPNGDALPIRMATGFAWQPREHVTFCGEVMKDIRYQPTIKGGLEVAPIKKLKVRTGFNLFPQAMYAGIGLRAWKTTFDYAVSFSYAMSYSHQLSITFSGNKP